MVFRIKHSDCMHQFLLGNGRVVDLSRCDDGLNDVWCTALKPIDINTGIEEQRATGEMFFACKG